MVRTCLAVLERPNIEVGSHREGVVAFVRWRFGPDMVWGEDRPTVDSESSLASALESVEEL